MPSTRIIAIMVNLRQIPYALATNDRLEAAVRRSPRLERLAYRAALRYVAGRTLEEAIAVVHDLHAQGMAVSLDLFGESVTDPAAVQAAVQGYARAAEALGSVQGKVDFEVVPSRLGIDVGVGFCRRYAEQLVELLPPGGRLQLSAEESWRADQVLELALGLAAAGAPLRVTLQANLRRAPRDAEQLLAAGVPIRLVKGAYVEAPRAALPWGEPTDLAYVRLAHQIAAGGGDLAIGTHDPVIRESLLLALPGLAVEMLLGVRTADAVGLVRRGHHVRVYVPYGDAWFRYWARRLAEAWRRRGR